MKKITYFEYSKRLMQKYCVAHQIRYFLAAFTRSSLIVLTGAVQIGDAWRFRDTRVSKGETEISGSHSSICISSSLSEPYVAVETLESL